MGPELLIPLFAIVGTFASVIVFTYMYFSARNRERMALIERDKDASIFKQDKSSNNTTNALKYGILALMIGLGLFLADLLYNARILNSDFSFFAMVLLMSGLGFVIYFFIMQRINAKETGRETEDQLLD